MCKFVRDNFNKIAGGIFLVVGISHGVRAILAWPLVVGTWDVPVWLSAIAAVVLLRLAWVGWRK